MEMTAGVQHTALRVSDSISESIIGHLSKGWHSMKLTTVGVKNSDAWFTPIYQNTYTGGMVTSGDSVRGNFSGGIFGIDVTEPDVFGVLGNWTIGYSVNAGGGSSKAHGTVTSVKDKHYFGGANIYGGWNMKNLNIIAGAGIQFGSHEVQVGLPASMEMGTLKGTADTLAVTADARAEYNINTRAVSITPHIDMRYTALNTSSWKLKSGGEVVKFASDTNHVVQFGVGSAFSRSFMAGGWVLKPLVDLAYTPAISDNKAKTSMHFSGLNSSDSVSSRFIDRHSFTGKLNFTAGKDPFEIGIGYGIRASQHEMDHSLNANFVWKF